MQQKQATRGKKGEGIPLIGKHILITGAGTAGLSAAWLALEFGADKVSITEVDDITWLEKIFFDYYGKDYEIEFVGLGQKFKEEIKRILGIVKEMQRIGSVEKSDIT